MNNKNYLVLIRVISVVVPLLVAFLLFFPAKLNLGDWVYHIPAFNALLNTATSILLIAAIMAIKSKNIKWHQALMTSGFSLGAIFLLTYVFIVFWARPVIALAEQCKNGSAELLDKKLLNRPDHKLLLRLRESNGAARTN